jgi:hypothetical protein
MNSIIIAYFHSTVIRSLRVLERNLLFHKSDRKSSLFEIVGVDKNLNFHLTVQNPVMLLILEKPLKLL